MELAVLRKKVGEINGTDACFIALKKRCKGKDLTISIYTPLIFFQKC